MWINSQRSGLDFLYHPVYVDFVVRVYIVRQRRRTFVSTTRTGMATTTWHRRECSTFCTATSAIITATQHEWLFWMALRLILLSPSSFRSSSTRFRTTCTDWSECVRLRSLCTLLIGRCCITSTTIRAQSTVSRWVFFQCLGCWRICLACLVHYLKKTSSSSSSSVVIIIIIDMFSVA